MAETIALQVVGEKRMSCGGCESTVTGALAQLPGVQEVRADRTTQAIDVTLEPGATTVDALRQELKQIGYEVQVA